MLAIFIAQLKLCTRFEFAMFTFVSVCLRPDKKLKLLGKQDFVFDNSKALKKTEKVAFFDIYQSVQQFLNSVRILYSVLILYPVRVLDPVQSPVRNPCFILTDDLLSYGLRVVNVLKTVPKNSRL